MKLNPEELKPKGGEVEISDLTKEDYLAMIKGARERLGEDTKERVLFEEFLFEVRKVAILELKRREAIDLIDDSNRARYEAIVEVTRVNRWEREMLKSLCTKQEKREVGFVRT